MNIHSILKRAFCLAAAMAVTMAAMAGAPKYIFYFIGDGMGMAPVMATEAYLRLVKNEGQKLAMTQFENAGWVQTWSASSPVTDSAAAGTALSTGHKTNNGMLGMNADTVNVTSIAKNLQAMGFGIGLVTNGAADDATPAAFYAHVPNRSMYYEIGKDAAYCGYDFIAGSGLRGTKHKDGTQNDLYDVLEQNGVQILRGQDGARAVAQSQSRRIMLLNPEGYGDPNEMGFVTDNVGSDDTGLTLQIATRACMDHLLKNSPDRFFMMVEGSLIDHALHGNDGSSAIKEVIEMNACIDLALEFYEKHPDETLIVVTADHDTGGMSVGCKSTGYNAYPANVDCQKTSKGAFSDFCANLLKENKDMTWTEMQDILKEKMGFWTTVKLKESQTQELEKAFEDNFVHRNAEDEKGLYKTSNAFASQVFNIYSAATGWGFTTPNHTGNPVPVFAKGEGAQIFARMLNNTEIAPAILKLAQGE